MQSGARPALLDTASPNDPGPGLRSEALTWVRVLLRLPPTRLPCCDPAVTLPVQLHVPSCQAFRPRTRLASRSGGS